MKHSQPLVSIILPTKNSAKYLRDCLDSIKQQSYKNIEVLIIDSYSMDDTAKLAKTYAAKVYDFDTTNFAKKQFDAPFKRNFGAEKAKGKYVYYLDADMILPKGIIEEAVQLCEDRCDALVLSEDSFGVGIWAQAKQLERRCYWGDDTVEAARFFKKEVWKKLGGLDVGLKGGGDDWDLHHRLLEAGYVVERTKHIVLHNEGNLSLWSLAKKRFMYGTDSVKYLVKNPKSSFISYFPIRKAYIIHWRLFVNKPIVAIFFVIMRSVEYFAGFMGIVYSAVVLGNK